MEPRHFALALFIAIASLSAFADDGPPVTVTLESNRFGREGDGGYSPLSIRVRLDGPAAATVRLTIATVAGGTAQVGVDYLPLSEVLTFAPGEIEKFASVAIYGDLHDEEHETFVVTATQDGVVRGTATGTIRDDDDIPGARIADGSIIEKDGRYVTFLVTLTGPAKLGASFHYTLEDGTAVAGEDYQSASGTIHIPPGGGFYGLWVYIVADDIHEPDESLFVHLSNPVGAYLIDGTARGLIENDDVLKPGYTVAEASGPEGHTGSSQVELRVTLVTASTSSITATVIGTGGGTALAGADYEVLPQSITFPPGVTEAIAHATIFGDTTEETHENFEVGVYEDGLLRGAGMVTIEDDDDDTLPLAVSLADVTIAESDGIALVSFLLTLSRPAMGSPRVSYRTSDGTASAPGDYEHVSGQVEFAYGETSRAVTVGVVGDQVHEDAEALVLELFDGVGVTISDGSALCTITDDDPPKRRAMRH